MTMKKSKFYFVYPIFIVFGLFVIAACNGRSSIEVSEEDLKIEI
jgi:hypothetical protein